ncbi:hypothetical protein [Photorhabdus heterorhabditis]|uniref:hypothetical protein n=1 Tax=Photorhabdus heterorhabditis TaxID=880156 RepID=UPI0015628496|nr:hypothetical protein [Photorhabdus heterorhabditis]NRN27875.1 hypothetical protein [Photorhabdus heterorhabditis subsp. aluminescens]
MTGTIENFVVLVRINGETAQIKLTSGQKNLFCKILLGSLSHVGEVPIIPINGIELPADIKAFKK